MIPCCNSGIDIIRRLIYTSDNMTLPKRKGYSPPSNKCLSSKLRPTRIKESHILSHPLCTAFLLEKYKLKMILQNIANDIFEKPSFTLSYKQIDENVRLRRKEFGIVKCLKWNENRELDVLMLSGIYETSRLQEKVGEVFQRDRLTKDFTSLRHLQQSFECIKQLKRKHDSTNEQLREGLGGLRESKRSRNRLSDYATQYLLRWFEQHVTSPYPTKEQKEQIAKATGLTTKQVRNWYVN